MLIIKILSFSVVEILPKLLSKEKTTTVRLDKGKPRFKPGEQVKVVWKQMSPHKYFSTQTGKPWIKEILDWKEGHFSGYFKKEMGIIEITSVEKIEMKIADNSGLVMLKSDTILDPYMLARTDGFHDFNQFSECFRNFYDLKEWTPMYVYFFKWQ